MDHLKVKPGLPEKFRPLFYENDFDPATDFHSFPGSSKAGWSINDDLSFSPTSQTIRDGNVPSFNRFIQSWLFFGLIATVVKGREWKSNFHFHFLNSAATRIDTEKLESFLIQWGEMEQSTPQGRIIRMFKAQVALDRAREIVQAYCSSDGKYSELSPQSLTKIDNRLGLSLMVLGETLANAKYKISERVDYHVRGWHADASKGWGTPSIVIEEMENHHWCKRTITTLKGQLSSHATALLSVYISNSEEVREAEHHKDCTAEKCMAVVRDKSMPYETKHVVGCSKAHCTKIGPDPQKLAECINDNVIPLLEYRNDLLGHATVHVVRHEAFMPYATFSHVWSHGYGNPEANELWKCQLDFFKALMDKRELKGSEPNSLRFWIDTLAIPVHQAHKIERRKAIRKIHDIYTQAKLTVVLDNGLSQLSPGSQYEDTAMKILASAWMRRLWTLQEAYLSNRLLFAFADEEVKSIDDLEEMYPEANNILASNIPTAARRYFHHLLGLNRKARIHKTAPTEGYALLASVWRAAQWRTTGHPEHETLAIATLLNIDYELYEMSIATAGDIPANTPRLDPWDPQMKEVSKLDNMMRDLWVLLDETCPGVIPPGIIFLPGERLSIKDFGWAPRTWLSGQDVDYPDPLSTMTTPAKFVPGKGLQVQYPGFLLHFNSANAILFPGKRHIEFPSDSSLLEWYQVEQADGDAAGKSNRDLSIEKAQRLAIILCRAKPRELPEIALLVKIVKDIPQRSSSGQTLSWIHKVDIICRVWVKRQGGIDYSQKLQDFNHRTEVDKDGFICGEELDSDQQWYVDASSRNDTSESRTTTADSHSTSTSNPDTRPLSDSHGGPLMSWFPGFSIKGVGGSSKTSQI
ncbi:MAG: hypothetical protein Q9160_004051 [Pyrenula sp. 1 TL-2023]